MAGPDIAGLRQIIVVVLTFVLTLTSVGRGFVGTASPANALYAVPGAHVQICHSGAGEPSAPTDPASPPRHDCCDACALLAPAILPAPQVVEALASARVYAVHALALAWRPSSSRPWSPRQSQGPPVA